MTVSPELLPLFNKESPDWAKIGDVLRKFPTGASPTLDNETGTTALHLAVACRHAQEPQARLSVIKTLLALNPDSTSIRCKRYGYTALHYACFREDPGLPSSGTELVAQVRQDAKVVEMLLMANRKSTDIASSKRRVSPLSLHIMYMSQVKTSCPMPDDTSDHVAETAVLDVFARYCRQCHLEEALETLYSCNTLLVMDMLSREEARARRNIQQFGRQTRPSELHVWVWDWALTILRHIHCMQSYAIDGGCGQLPVHHKQKQQQEIPFLPLHVASKIRDCPTPFLFMAMRTCPGDVRMQDCKTGNLPIHSVASWSLENDGSACRKSMGLTSLGSEYPKAMNVKNKTGKTPEMLTQESGCKIKP